MADCLACGKALDEAMPVHEEEDRSPRPGDVSVCLYCGHIAAFADSEGRLRPLSDAEMIKIAGNKRLLAAVATIGRARKGVGR